MKRRQYSSCDACRASKRKCDPPSTPSNVSAATCPNCQRLGLTCTYNFASTKRSALQKFRNVKRARAQGFSVTLLPSQNGASGSGFGGGDGRVDAAWEPWVERDQDLGPWMNVLSSDMHVDPNLKPCDLSFGPSDLCAFSVPLEDPSDQIEEIISAASHSTQINGVDLSDWKREEKSLEDLSPYSPIGLLNFSLDANIMADHLRKIYNTILTVCSSSFLSYGCNLFSTGRRYWFEDSTNLKPSVTFEMESDIFDSFTESSKSPLWRQSPPRDLFSQFPKPENYARANDTSKPRHDIMYRMTPVGNVRFLDHFGELYGNRLDQTDHEKSDIVLRDVIRAFSTQWMASARYNPSDTCMGGRSTRATESRDVTDLGSNAYLETWFKAQSSIQRYRSIKSFRVILALFLFDMIAVPVSLWSPERPQKTDNLDYGICQLRHLEKLVEDYCKTLGPNSKYGNILQASLDIIRWFAVLRDTTSALISADRKCQYPVVFRSQQKSLKPKLIAFSADQAESLVFTETLDVKYLDICKEAISEMYLLWRHIDDLPSLSGNDDLDRLTFEIQDSDRVALIMEAIDNYERTFSSFMRQCFENCSKLSIRTRAFSAFLVINWNLGVLTFAEYLQRAQPLLPPLSRLTMASKMNQYKWCAIQSIAAMTSNLLLASPDEALTHETGISSDIPVFSYHATSHLIVRSLFKAIEVAVSLQNSEKSLSGPHLGHGIDSDPNKTWSLCVKSLLKSLIALEASVWGSHSARAALHSLMRRHGDVLLACWMVDQVPLLLGNGDINISAR